MGIMVPETCWANNEFCNKETNMLHLVGLSISMYSGRTLCEFDRASSLIRGN
jgi:hypothetical protein